MVSPQSIRRPGRIVWPVVRVLICPMVMTVLLGAVFPLRAELQFSTKADPSRASTSRASRKDALKLVPLNRLAVADKAKVNAVLSNISIFRRLPTRVVDCDPKLYKFLVENPDVVTNIWEVLKISRLKIDRLGPQTFEIVEQQGTRAEMEILYTSPEVHLAYGEGTYQGPLFARPVRGRCVVLLSTGYVREPNGRYHITSRMDAFVSVEDVGVELLAKLCHPLVGRTADMNFTQSVDFLGSLSRTAEVNARGVLRLCAALERVEPQRRQRLAELTNDIASKSISLSSYQAEEITSVAQAAKSSQQ